MRWQPFLAVLTGLMLPLPIVLAVGAERLWPDNRAFPQEPQKDMRAVSPILSLDERRALLTHERPCKQPEDCEPPLGCVPLLRGQALCSASECQTDLQCAEGFTCKALRSLGQGPLVRLCVVQGLADEGTLCFPSFTFKREMVCRPGLLCNTYCGRPCQPGEPESCPEGSSCMEGSEGPSCMPHCEEDACAEGQQCVRLEKGFSVCAQIRGENCQSQSCPEGTSCHVRYLSGRPRQIQLECIRKCGDGHPACPNGTVCEQGDCRRPCDPADANACGLHASCTWFPITKRRLCYPVTPREQSPH